MQILYNRGKQNARKKAYRSECLYQPLWRAKASRQVYYRFYVYVSHAPFCEPTDVSDGAIVSPDTFAADSRGRLSLQFAGCIDCGSHFVGRILWVVLQVSFCGSHCGFRSGLRFVIGFMVCRSVCDLWYEAFRRMCVRWLSAYGSCDLRLTAARYRPVIFLRSDADTCRDGVPTVRRKRSSRTPSRQTLISAV